MKKIILATLLFIMLNTSFAFAAPRDIQNHWAGSAINTLLEQDIVKGYSAQRFRPDRNITREEACALMVTFGERFGVFSREEVENAEAEVSDLNLNWSKPFVLFSVKNGLLPPREDALFHTKDYITRDEFASMINQYDLIVSSGAAFEKRQIYSGYPDGSYHLENLITRAEVAVVLEKIAGFPKMELLITLPKFKQMEVKYISQLAPVYAPVGCEGTALLMALHYKGYAKEVSLKPFLDRMPKHTSNPEKGFVGSPYVPDKEKKTRTTILPAPLTKYAKQYGKVSDFSGSSPRELQAELLDGNPVVVYATMYWEEPVYRFYNVEGQNKRYLSNNHAVLVAGYNTKTNEYYIVDPYNYKTWKNPKEEYKYWINGATFERIYNERRHAVVVE